MTQWHNDTIKQQQYYTTTQCDTIQYKYDEEYESEYEYDCVLKLLIQLN